MNTFCFFLMLAVSIHCLPLQHLAARKSLHSDKLALVALKTTSQSQRELRSSMPTATCPIIQCVGLGQTCNVTGSPYYLCSPTTQVCITNVNTTTCQAQVQAGGACNVNLDQCVSNYECLNGICVLVPYVPPGYACSSNSQCYFQDDNYNLVNSTCINGLCYSYSNGHNCTTSLQCNAQSVCINETCSPLYAQGAACSTANDNCGGTTFCYSGNSTSTQGVCTQAFSVPVGGYCSESADCRESLYCNASSQCAVPPSLTYGSCNTSSDCQYTEYCACNYHTGYSSCQNAYASIPIGATAVVNAYYSCYARTLCSDDACLFSYCKSAYCNLLGIEGLIPTYATIPSCALTAAELLQYQTCSSTSPAWSAFATNHITAATLLLFVLLLI